MESSVAPLTAQEATRRWRELCRLRSGSLSLEQKDEAVAALRAGADVFAYPGGLTQAFSHLLKTKQTPDLDWLRAIAAAGIDRGLPHWLELLWPHTPHALLEEFIEQGADLTPVQAAHPLPHRCLNYKVVAKPTIRPVWRRLIAQPQGPEWVRTPRPDGGTPWHALSAANLGIYPDPEVGRWWANELTALGVDINQPNQHGLTSLMRTAFVQTFLAHGANPHAVTESGQNALHFQAPACLPEDAQALVAAGISINAQDALGNTALHYAIIGSKLLRTRSTHTRQGGEAHQQRVETLIALGADPHLKNEAGLSPRDLMAQADRLGEMWSRVESHALQEALMGLGLPDEAPRRRARL